MDNDHPASDTGVIKSTSHSILKDMKQLLGVEEGSTNFDRDVIIHINSAIFALSQLGVGSKGFSIKGHEETWEELVPESYLEGVKQFLYLHARLAFDPPQMGYYVNLMKEQRDEMAWRIVHQIENEEGGEENVDNNQ